MTTAQPQQQQQQQRRSKNKRAASGNNKNANNNSNNNNNNNNNGGYGNAPSAVIDEASKQAYNYGVVSMHDPKLAQIFATSSICNVYKYNVDQDEWEKLDCQGTLFVYSRRQDVQSGNAEADNGGGESGSGKSKRRKKQKNNANITATPATTTASATDSEAQAAELLQAIQGGGSSTAAPQEQQQQQQQQPEPESDPYPYGLMVLNRLSLENFSLGIMPHCFAEKYDLPEMDSKLEEPFIMVEGTDGGMYGLWVFQESDREYIQQVIEFCLNAKFEL